MERAGRVIQAKEGERLCLRPPTRGGEVVVKADPANAGARRLAMGTQLIEPGGRIPIHLHEGQEEILFITGGAGVATVGEERAAVGPGDTAFVPEGVWHGVENPGPEPLTLVWVISPPGLEEMFREIGAPPGSSAEPLTSAEFAAIAARHGMKVRE